MSTARAARVIYTETQYMRMGWVWVMMAVIWAFMLAGLVGLLVLLLPAIESVMRGDLILWNIVVSGIVSFLITLAIPLWMSKMRMDVTIDEQKIRIFLWPWFPRVFETGSIVSVKARATRPFLEFGSFGARRRRGWGRAYLIRGNMGVEFKLKDGKHLFIGSGRAEEFARAMEEWLSSKCAPGSASGV